MGKCPQCGNSYIKKVLFHKEKGLKLYLYIHDIKLGIDGWTTIKAHGERIENGEKIEK